MYLKQLTLRGFKSFATTTKLAFEPGITCVVGPNGSGKSNVVDALAWVMGEQGAKSLRGGKMEDVIFAGTAKKAPLGRAEVELTIDNTDGALPIEYAEVTITRTMFRSGGSEYAINGNPSRLLDVQELLSDSGIGREMHVIVGQGQLDAILQATPESRRGFIEEAAGVLKHRKRKEKALRKLEGTKANLERLSDLIGELQRQLKPLGRQAETARKAAVIQAELRDAKARLLADDLQAASSALQADLADEAAMLEQRTRLEGALAQAQQAEQEAEQRLKMASSAYDEAQETWYALAGLAERVASTTSIAAERMRAGHRQPQLDFGGRDPAELEREAAEVLGREKELGAKVAQAHSELTSATLRRNEAEAEHAAADQEYQLAMRAIADRREGLARLTGKVNSLTSRLEARSEELERLARQRSEAEQRAATAAQSYLDEESSLAGLGASESELDTDYEVASEKLATVQQEADELREQEATLTREKAALEARAEALTLATAQQPDGTAHLLAAGLGGLGQQLSEALEIEPGWEAAVAAGLREAAEAVVATDLSAALTGVRYLTQENLGRSSVVIAGYPAATAVPGSLLERVTAPPELAGTLSRLLGDIVAVEDLAAAERAIAVDPELRVVTREGQLLSAWLAEGGTAGGPSLLELVAQLNQAQDELAATGRQLDQLRFAASKVAQKLGAAKEAEATTLAALHSSDAALAAVTDKLAQHKQTQAAAHKETERLAEAIQAAAKGREEDENRLAELQARLEAAAQDEIPEPDSQRRDESAQVARQARQVEMEARLALRSAEEQAKALAGRAEALLASAEQERASRAKAQAKAAQLRNEAEVARSVQEAAAALATHVVTARQQATSERELADQERRSAEASVVRSRHAVKDTSAKLEEAVRGAHKDEMARIEHQMRLEQLTERAITELGMGPEALVGEYGPEQLVPILTRPDGAALTEDDERPEPVPYQREEQAKRLRRAERNLQVLGRINPLALEEYDAMLTRHSFLAEQLEDLKRTRADLLEIIGEVDKRVQEVFEVAYREVEQAFEKAFARLFPGGEGKLVLTDPGDWLNTGVDVEARPAGKQVKRLSLLSGGERSLVAVAFLVSLFIARPSPFYILDEVEAALDDANLGRLLQIYEELRANSQLIVITHQKRTMEIADTLYGVSMRGDGISSVVSQRLAESS